MTTYEIVNLIFQFLEIVILGIIVPLVSAKRK